MKRVKFEILEWDSYFFQFGVGRINYSDEDELPDILYLLKEANVDLVYYSSKNKLKRPDTVSPLFIGKLVDKKITYVKAIEKVVPFHHSIAKYDKDYPDDKLIELAIQSGAYSRFKIDEKIPDSKFNELYKLWIVNSVNKKIAWEVLLFVENESIAGFVTLGKKNERADIGIFAVDKARRGKGIGKSLIQAAESWFVAHNYDTIQVVTQGDNVGACKLYESCGYSVAKSEFFYHFWRR